MSFTKTTSLLCLIFLLISCQPKGPKADLIITNANIWTSNNVQPKAQALAISADTILAVGTNAEIQNFKGSNSAIVNANGKFITPGFIDSHVHLMMGGNSLLSVELRDAATPEEFSKRISDYAQTLEKGKWVEEGNWDHTLWGGELPNKSWIDANTVNNPVAVYRLDGHMILANSAALKLAGIDKNTVDVLGGEIIRNKDGEPTGILKDNAMNAVLDIIPSKTDAEKNKIFRAAMEYFAANGVTSVHDVDSLGTYKIADKLSVSEELKTRIYAIHPLYRWQELAGINHQNDKWVKMGGVKGFVDGSLGSHTAAFHHAYKDKPNDKGFFIHEPQKLYQWISDADKANLQVTVHAIGDSAIHELLDIYERIIAENGPKDRRLRIEHAQHLAKADIVRFAQLGVIASVQPYHAIDDGRWAEEVIGPERIKTTYAFKSLLDAQAKLAFGSDWAVAPAAPLLGIYAAVTRRTLDDKNPEGWVPEQKVTVEQALQAYTIDAAYAAFEEDIKGSLEVGKLADFVVLNEDITKIEPAKIKDSKVLQTWVGGQKVFDSKK